METKDTLLQLRKDQGLTQDELADKLFVTRQAVSRWETGDTVPSLDTLALIAETFAVPVDHLLGHPAGQCQSCGMALEKDSDRGTELGGGKSAAYCAYCYKEGAFAHDITLEQQVEHNLQDLDEWNKAAGLQLTPGQARAQLLEFLPTLKRWQAQ